MDNPSNITKHGAWRLAVLERVDSTNSWLVQQYDAGKATAGDAVRAIEQSAGKGRQGKQWLSSENALYLSLLVRDEEAFGTRWALVIGLAVREAIINAMPTLDGQLRLKWP
ncbi:MAG: hypothetical protein AAF556_05975, partial [Pseudomonadota bacterium]